MVGSATTVYLYSGTKPIAEYVNGSLSKEYIYAGSTLLATIAGTSTTYHHPDHLSNRAETDSTGAVVRTAGHFPYGESWYESAVDPMKFTAYTRDSGTGETGLDYAMFRHYNSGQGRFMSADLMAGSLAIPQSMNRYDYAVNDVVNAIDPLGLSSFDVYSSNGNCTIISTYNTVEKKTKSGTWTNVNVLIGTQVLCAGPPGGAPPNVGHDPNLKGLACPKNKGLKHFLPHGFGGVLNGEASAGIATTGAIATGSFSSGFWVSDSGQVSSGGLLSGGATAFNGSNDHSPFGSHTAAAPAQTKIGPMALGGYLGAGGGLFLTNAQSANQELGPFAQWNANIGIGPGYSLSVAYDDESGIYVLNFTQGPGVGLSGSALTTTTTGLVPVGCE